MKHIKLGNKAREALRRGANKAADVITCTLGPRGMNVVYGTEYYTPTVTNDGLISIAQVKLDDPIEQMGAELIMMSTGKTNTNVGDGTTTTTTIAQTLINQYGETKNPMDMRNRLTEEAERVTERLKELAIPIETDEQIRQIATISAESEEIGDLVADVVKKVGKDGVVVVQESQSSSTEVEIVNGMKTEEGYLSPYMVNTEKGEALIEDAPVIVTTERIDSVKNFIPFLENLVGKTGERRFVLVCDGLDAVTLGTIIANKAEFYKSGGAKAFEINVMKLPVNHKEEVAQDIATITGGTVISSSTGVTFKTFDPTTMVGRCDKVTMKSDSTTFVGGKGTKIKEEIEKLRQLPETPRRNSRIANLSGGVALIKVGASTDTEMKYLKLKIDDAVNATAAAIADGVVEGGGMTLYRLSHEFPLLKKGMQAPLKQIMKNAGKNWLQRYVLLTLLNRSTKGYDAKNDTTVDLIERGIIDPVKVTINAIRNATSTAGIFITTNVAISKELQK